MWSFVEMKSNKKWIWLAIDVDTKQIVGVYVGSRSRIGAQRALGFITAGLSTVRCLLYGFLVSL